MDILIGFAIVVAFVMFVGAAMICWACCAAASDADKALERFQRETK